MHRNTVENGTIDLKCLNIECAFHLTQSGKFVSFSLSSIPMCSCNRLCNCLAAFSIISVCFPCGKYYGHITHIVVINPGAAFAGFVCLIYELVSAFNFKLLNGLSRGLYLSIISVAFQMLFPVHIAIYCHRMSFRVSKIVGVCSNFADFLFQIRSKNYEKSLICILPN